MYEDATVCQHAVPGPESPTAWWGTVFSFSGSIEGLIEDEDEDEDEHEHENDEDDEDDSADAPTSVRASGAPSPVPPSFEFPSASYGR